MSATRGLRKLNNTDVVFDAGKQGDAYARIEVHADGTIVQGDGTIAPATTLTGGASTPSTLAPFAVGPQVGYVGSSAPVAGTIEYSLIPVTRTLTVNRFLMSFATSSGNVEVGIYDSTGTAGAPGTKLVSAAVQACPAVGSAAIVLSPTVLAPGIYYAACAFSAAPSLSYGEERSGLTAIKTIRYTETRATLPATATPVAAFSYVINCLMFHFGVA